MQNVRRPDSMARITTVELANARGEMFSSVTEIELCGFPGEGRPALLADPASGCILPQLL